MWLIEFDSKKEAKRILREGLRNLGNFSFSLEKWSEEVGSMRGREEATEAWVRIIGVSSASLESLDPEKGWRQLRRFPSCG